VVLPTRSHIVNFQISRFKALNLGYEICPRTTSRYPPTPGPRIPILESMTTATSHLLSQKSPSMGMRPQVYFSTRPLLSRCLNTAIRVLIVVLDRGQISRVGYPRGSYSAPTMANFNIAKSNLPSSSECLTHPNTHPRPHRYYQTLPRNVLHLGSHLHLPRCLV
jgi:hypothetical protein